MDMTHPLLALGGFGSIGMLFWAAAAVIPIILHLWNRRAQREVPWAAMEYLLAAVRKNARRIRLENLLLLAVRAAILVLLGLALADPVLSWFAGGGGFSGGENRRRHFVLVLDASYSMETRAGEESRFELARRLAAEVVDQSRQGDGFSLMLLADPPRTIIGRPAFDREDVISELENLLLLHGGASLAQTLPQIEQLLAAAREHHPQLGETRLYFFTDLGASTWRAALEPRAREQVARLAEQVQIWLVDVGQAGAENLALTDLRQLEPYAIALSELTFQATVRNLGRQDRTRLGIELLVDGRRVDQQQVDVGAQEETTVSFRYRFDTPGEHWVGARLEDDALEVDNHRYLAVPTTEALRVLCVEGKQGEARNVALALEPYRAERPRINVHAVSESALLELDLHGYDGVVLCNVGRFGRDETAVLHEYLRGGGGLVFFLGDQVQPESYNLELGGELSGLSVLPARLSSLTSDGQYRLEPRDYRHPIVAAFRGQERTGLLTAPVWRYLRLQPHQAQGARVALWFDSGDPAIVERSILRGRSVLVATAASEQSLDRTTQPPTPWTAWSAWPSFPPLIQEIVAFAVQDRSRGRNVLVGQELQGAVRSIVPQTTVSIARSGQPPQRVRLETDGEESRWTLAQTDWSGIYETRFEPPAASTPYYAVNVDTRESDPSRVDLDELPEQFTRHQVQEHAAQARLLPADASWALFRVVLACLLGLLLAETYLAWRLGTAQA